jgi:hypothetical protein
MRILHQNVWRSGKVQPVVEALENQHQQQTKSPPHMNLEPQDANRRCRLELMCLLLLSGS